MEKLIVDRMEQDFAVCEQEDRSMIDVLLVDLPKGVVAGDVLRKTANGYQIDAEETENRRLENIRLFRSLMEE